MMVFPVLIPGQNFLFPGTGREITKYHGKGNLRLVFPGITGNGNSRSPLLWHAHSRHISPSPSSFPVDEPNLFLWKAVCTSNSNSEISKQTNFLLSWSVACVQQGSFCLSGRSWLSLKYWRGFPMKPSLSLICRYLLRLCAAGPSCL